MTKTKPWWVCRVCGKAVAQVGKLAKQAMLAHREECTPLACFSIKRA